MCSEQNFDKKFCLYRNACHGNSKALSKISSKTINTNFDTIKYELNHIYDEEF